MSSIPFLSVRFMTRLIFVLLAATLSLATPAWAEPSPPPAVNPLATPELPPSTLLAWAERAVINTLSFNYKNFKSAQKTASQYFTPDAWKEYNRALAASGNINTIKERKLGIISTITSAPTIVNQGVVGGYYSWTIQLPMSITYQNLENQTAVQTQNSDVTVTVIKTPPNVNPQGIAINSLVMKNTKQ